MTALSTRERQLCEFIRAFQVAKAYLPSQRQMMQALGYKSVKSVQQLLTQLDRKGVVVRTPRAPRTTRVNIFSNGAGSEESQH